MSCTRNASVNAILQLFFACVMTQYFNLQWLVRSSWKAVSLEPPNLHYASCVGETAPRPTVNPTMVMLGPSNECTASRQFPLSASSLNNATKLSSSQPRPTVYFMMPLSLRCHQMSKRWERRRGLCQSPDCSW